MKILFLFFYVVTMSFAYIFNYLGKGDLNSLFMRCGKFIKLC